MTAHLSACRILSLAAALWLCPDAHAQLYRTYLASDGSDANPCTLTQPCRLLPAALNAVRDGGEVWMLDSANYNSAKVVIAKSVTIMAVPGATGSIVTSGGPAIEIPARPPSVPEYLPVASSVTLRNLAIRPVNTNGTTGISMTSAGLTLDNCSIAGVLTAIWAQESAVYIKGSSITRGHVAYPVLEIGGYELILANTDVLGDVYLSSRFTTVSNSTLQGRVALQGESVVISGTTIAGSISAIGGIGATSKVDLVQTTVRGIVGVTSDGVGTHMSVSVHQSRILQSGVHMVARGSGTMFVAVTDSVIANATLAGIWAQSVNGGPSKVFVSGSTITGSQIAFWNDGGYTFESAGNNALRGNELDYSGTITVVPLK